MQNFLAFTLILALTSWSTAFGNDEPNALDDGNLMGNREIVPLDQIQTKPWGPVGNKPQFAFNTAQYQAPYFGGYPQQGNQMYMLRNMGPQQFQFQQQYQPTYQQQQPSPYQMGQEFQQPFLPMAYGPPQPIGNEFYGPQDRGAQVESSTVVPPNLPPGIPPNPAESPMPPQMWGPQQNMWGNQNGLYPSWKRSYTPLPGQSGCFNRCRPSCNPYSCQSSCQSACNIRPTCGRRGPVMFSGSTMICGRQGLTQRGLWPEVNQFQDYQNSYGQVYPQPSNPPSNNNQVGVEAY